MIRYLTDIQTISPEQLNGFFVGWKEPLTTDQHYQSLKNSEHRVVAFDEEENRIVGFVSALTDRVNFAFIPLLEVLPDYRGRGIGKELLNRMMKILEPYQCVDLTCDPSVQAFYEQFGMLKSHGMIIRRYLENE